MVQQVVLVPHSPDWAEEYRQESARIARAMAPNYLRSHHIGSTSIHGIYAKPILDILVEVDDIDDDLERRADDERPS